MRKTKELQEKLFPKSFLLVLALILWGCIFSGSVFESRAESQGKITAASVNIRKEPNTSSQVVGSTERDKVISIISQEQGADGMTWYKVYVDANTIGYIRSDLMTITDGTTPPTGTSAPQGTATPPPAQNPETDEPSVQMEEVYPASATVIGDSVKILDAVGGEEIAQVQNGTALTVTAHGKDASETVWYKVSFISNDTVVEGFVQSVYVSVSDELTPVTEDPPEDETPPAEPEPTAPPKQYETLYKDGEWLIYNTDKPTDGYSIQELLDGADRNGKLYEDSLKTIKNQKLIIIILVFLLVAAVAGIGFLVFKVRDMMDSAYFNEVENETLRRKNAGGNSGSGYKTVRSSGGDRQQVKTSGARPAGANPDQRQQGTAQRQQGTAQRPAAGSAQNQRGGSSPVQRPAGALQRPAGASQSQRGEGMPQGHRPAPASQGQRPAGTQGQRASAVQGQRQSGMPQRQQGAPQGQRNTGAPQGARPPQSGGQKTQSRNFMADEDEEFEFEFLNYEGEDQK